MNGVVSKDTRARSKKLSGTKTVTKYISKNNYLPVGIALILQKSLRMNEEREGLGRETTPHS